MPEQHQRTSTRVSNKHGWIYQMCPFRGPFISALKKHSCILISTAMLEEPVNVNSTYGPPVNRSSVRDKIWTCHGDCLTRSMSAFVVLLSQVSVALNQCSRSDVQQYKLRGRRSRFYDITPCHNQTRCDKVTSDKAIFYIKFLCNCN